MQIRFRKCPKFAVFIRNLNPSSSKSLIVVISFVRNNHKYVKRIPDPKVIARNSLLKMGFFPKVCSLG